jgi:Protein of unknown function (DUF998)
MVTRDTASVNDRSTTRGMLAGGAIGPVLFVLVFLIEGWTRTGYDSRRMFVSLLSLTADGWQQIGNFLVTGLLFICGAIGWWRAMPDGPGSEWGPILIGLGGVGLVGAGVFVTDPANGYPPGWPPLLSKHASLHGAIHQLASIFVFSGLPAAMFVMARRFRQEGSRWAAYSVASGVGMLVAFVGMITFDDVMGLLQRIAIVIGFGWVAQVSWRLRRSL